MKTTKKNFGRSIQTGHPRKRVVKQASSSLPLRGDILKYGVQLKFPITNNEAEYEAILMGLRIAQALAAKYALIRSDSQLIIRQVKGDFKAKETRMQKYLKLTNQLVRTFDRVEFAQVPRDQNADANEVARSAYQARVTDWKLEEQNSPSIEEF